MPTFEDPAKDADELSEAARGLAYATRRISVPDDTYRVLGSMHSALTSVQQSLRQLANWHERHSPFAATDDGDRAAGQEQAAKASGWLTIAAASLDQVVQLVMTAQSENGRIAWQPEPSPLDQAFRSVPQPSTRTLWQPSRRVRTWGAGWSDLRGCAPVRCQTTRTGGTPS